MIRTLSILAAIVALVVSAAPVASAGSSNQPTPLTLGAGKDRGWVKATPKPRGFTLDIDVEALDVVKARSAKGHRTPVGSALHGTSSGSVGFKSARPAGNGIIAILIG